MHTPPLRRRLVGSGLGLFTVLIVALGVFVVVSLRASLEDSLEQLLEDRAELALQLQRTNSTEALPARLREVGVPAVVTDADGEVLTVPPPAVPRFGPGPPGRATDVESSQVSRTVDLPDGGRVEVFATRAGVDATVQRVLLLVAVGGVLTIVLAALLLRRATASAMAPLTSMVAATRRTAEGERGQRMRPDDPTTELGELARAHDEMLDTLEAALDRAEGAEERTRRFLDDAAHQLRTPISSIRATVESLLSSTDSQQQDRLMAHLVRETSRASRLLRDLLTMARLDTGRPPAHAPVDLRLLCEEEVARARSLAPHLTITLDATDSAVVEADTTGIQEAVANLLDNARRHARTRATVAVTRDDEQAHIEVADDGPGIRDEARELIFERFATLDGHGGSGLGLPIGRSIARAHGGDLRYDHDRFVLSLPVER